VRISKIERGVDLYNQILNSDKTKLLEKNKELSQEIEKYIDDNNEIRMFLENKEQEMEMMNKNMEIHIEKVKIGAMKILMKIWEKSEKRIKTDIFKTLKS